MTEVNNKDNQNPKELNFHQLSEELFKLHNELRKNPQSFIEKYQKLKVISKIKFSVILMKYQLKLMKVLMRLKMLLNFKKSKSCKRINIF